MKGQRDSLSRHCYLQWMGHDFSNLSPADFEDLVHDLLEAEWAMPLECFKTGRDQGIDLRYAPASGGSIIVQCKHYLETGFSGLRRDLRVEELLKVQRLMPERYVVATAVPLLVEHKDKILKDLAPFVREAGDIIGGDEISALLRKHPKVETAHHKLWLTSTAVLQRVLHAADRCKTEFRIDRIRKALPIYVQSPAYDRALEILDHENVLIISGLPGVGKTTLAEMLIYAHMADGYTPAIIEDHVKEGRRLFDRQARTIFYFDDFLGETFLGDRKTEVGRNHDEALLEFMEQVRDSNSRFILTTREHILSSALLRSERLAHSSLAEDRFILELGYYGRAERARILYNHVHFNDLPADHRAELNRDDFFLEIVDHEHFNPRVIRWLTNYSSLKAVPAKGYRRHVQALLDDPAEVWRHAFEHELSRASRYLLLVLYTASYNINATDLRPIFEHLYGYAARRYNLQAGPGDFNRALRELDNAFITIDRHRDIRFLNPSIRDYLASVLLASINDIEDIIASMLRFQQGASLWTLAQNVPDSELARWLDSHRDRFLVALSTCDDGHYDRWERRDGRIKTVQFDLEPTQRLRILLQLYLAWNDLTVIDLTKEVAKRSVEGWERRSVLFLEVISTIRLMARESAFMRRGGAAIVQCLEDGIAGHLQMASSWQWVAILGARDDNFLMGDAMNAAIDEALSNFLDDGVLDELASATTDDELDSLLSDLEILEDKYGFGLRRRIETAREDRTPASAPDDEGGGGVWRGPIATGRHADDDEIRQLFGAK